MAVDQCSRTHPASALLDAATEASRAELAAAARKFELAAAWAEAHPAPVEDDVVDADGTLVMHGDQPLTIAGEGAPGMSEFAVAEFAAAAGMSTHAGRAFIGAAVECKHRLPLLWARVLAGQVPTWKARRVTERTHRLPRHGAAYVDARLAPILHACTWRQVDEAIAKAEAETDLERFELDHVDHQSKQYLEVDLRDAADNHGLVPIRGLLDHADARALEEALQAGAHALYAEHPELDLDVRRAMAAGRLASDPAPAREIVVYTHHDPADPDAVLMVEGLGPVPVDQLFSWCTAAGTKVSIRPVLELDQELTVDRYRPTERQCEQAVLTCPTCVFPGCGRDARSCDLDHVVPYGRGGATTSWNLAPLCRLHHRLKTHGRWSYRRRTRTSFDWTSPLGRTYHVDLSRRRRRIR